MGDPLIEYLISVTPQEVYPPDEQGGIFLEEVSSLLARLIAEKHTEEDGNDRIDRILFELLKKFSHWYPFAEQQFISKAKQAYRAENGTPKRGKKSLEFACIQAISEAYYKRGISRPPKDVYWDLFDELASTVTSQNKTEIVERIMSKRRSMLDAHKRPSQSQLVKMIRDKVKDPKTGKPISERRARPYARQWENEMYGDTLTIRERISLHRRPAS